MLPKNFNTLMGAAEALLEDLEGLPNWWKSIKLDQVRKSLSGLENENEITVADHGDIIELAILVADIRYQALSDATAIPKRRSVEAGSALKKLRANTYRKNQRKKQQKFIAAIMQPAPLDV